MLASVLGSSYPVFLTSPLAFSPSSPATATHVAFPAALALIHAAAAELPLSLFALKRVDVVFREEKMIDEFLMWLP